jgi:hypothetical protein
VEGYKRTISRLGRWQWQPFDQAFNNGFSHGKGGNVGDSGVEGFQRQMKISDTGYIGQETFNTLRSARIPEELANGGDMAMDARSVELINAAFLKFGGREPPPPVRTTAAAARLSKARSQIGVVEAPPRSNMQMYGKWYGMNGVPWCAIFATWCDQTGGTPTESFARGRKYAYVPYIVNDARLGLNGLSITSRPEPGDLVCYDWGRDGEYDHVGIVRSRVDSQGHFVAVEGNTSNADNSNGGQVMERTRNITKQNTVFVRVREPT